MANQDWLYRESAPLIVAAKAAGITGAQKQQVDGLAWISAKHKTLMKMPTDQAMDEYAKLDRKTQAGLKQFFGETAYNKPNGNLIDKAVSGFGDFFSNVSSKLEDYNEFLSRPFRAAAIVDDVGSWSRAWEKAEDGKRLFDADREEALKGIYDANTLTIAKRMTMGDTIGDILSDLKTPEEFAAMRKMLEGDETSVMALRDFGQAQISFGRSVAHLFGLDPDAGKKDQGIEGAIFKGVSGVADAVYTIGFDPATWITGGLSAYRKAALGMMSIQAASAGELSGMQKAISGTSKFFGKGPRGFTWDETFANPKVAKAWDDLGVHLKTIRQSKNPAERAVASIRAQELFPSLDASSIEVLATRNVFSAADGLRFMKDNEGASLIMRGRSGSMERMLPAYTLQYETRKAITKTVNKITGYDRRTAKLDDFKFGGSDLEAYTKGQDVVASTEARKVRQYRRVVGRMFEKAFVNKSIYTGGFDDQHRSMRALSSDSIYTLARVLYDKPMAKAMQHAFVHAEREGEARLIVQGLYKTIADKSGATATSAGKTQVDRLFAKWTDAMYAPAGYISEATAKAGRLGGDLAKGGVYNHAAIGKEGVQFAPAMYNVTHEMLLPPIHELLRVTEDEGRFLSHATGLRDMNHWVTDFWSALNLIPRLGIRSVMDEGLFSALTMPVGVALNAMRGYQATTTQRLLTDVAMRDVAGGASLKKVNELKSVGSVARHVLRPLMTTGLTTEAVREAIANPKIGAKLIETQLTKSVLGHALFAGPEGKKLAKYVADYVEMGSYDQIRAMSDGLSMATSGGIAAMGGGSDNVLPLIHESVRKDMNDLGIRLGGKPTTISRGQTTFHVNANIQLLNVLDRNGEIGQRSVRFMENPEAAVKSIVEYFNTPEGRAVYKQFDRSSMKSVEDNAFDMYVHVRQQFTNDMDVVNDALLAKIRPNGYGSKDKLTARNLTIDDIKETADGFRSQLFGYASEMKYLSSLPTFMDHAITNTFAVMDRQIGTLSREPAVLAYAFHFRDKNMAAEKAFERRLIKMGTKPETAAKMARRKYVNLSMDMATNRVLGFVDNPNVRSNVAYAARNVARYYRANEDFYRRAGRVFREQGGEAFMRLRVANEGMESSGFIHEDADGEKYFTMPVDEIMHNVYASMMSVLGVEVKRPLPLALTGKIKMMTPSLDPESNLPTFAGPFMSIGWSVLRRAGIIPEEYSDSVTRGLFGQYAEGQSWFDQITPSSLKRVNVAFKAAFGIDDEQVTSATMKAMAMHAANGDAPGSDSTLAEREEFKRSVKGTARSIIFLKNMLGLVSFVSPQLSEIQDIPKELLNAGVQPFKQEFQNLVQAEYDKGNTDAWNTAMVKWTKINPGRLVYTVSQSEADTVATIRKTRQSVEWIQQNRGLAEKYKEAAVFLMPQANNFDMDAYSFLKREGFIKTKDVDKYFEEIANVVTENHYYDVKKKYEDLIASTPPTMAGGYRDAMDNELGAIKKANPFLSRVFEQRDGTTQLKKDVARNMSDALDSGLVKDGDTTRRLRKMLSIYNSASAQVDSIASQTDAATTARKSVKAQAQEQLANIAGSNTNAILFYETILKRLLD